MVKCKCGKEVSKYSTRCKSCSNKERAGKYKVNRPKGIVMNWKKKMFNKKNPMWKGNNVGIGPLHDWVRRHKSKPKFCEKCNKALPFDLSNKSGKYKRDINDYNWLCRSCHMKEDYKNKTRNPRCREMKNGRFKCSKCNKYKLKQNFNINNRRKWKITSICKKCQKIVDMKTYNKNRRKILIRQKETRLNKKYQIW